MPEDYIFDDHLRYEGHKLIYTFREPTIISPNVW